MFPYIELSGFSSTAHSFLKWVGLAWLVYIVCLSVWIILQKRAPVSTLSWIFALAFIPYGGFIIYHFFGPQKLKRQQFKRLLSKTALREHSNLLQVRNHILATSAHSTELMQLSNMIRTTTGFPLTTARTLRLLVDGEQTFTAILEAVANATHHIHLEYYIYDPDEIGMTLRDLLIAKAEEGVKVRLLVDGIGSSRLKKAFIYPLIQAGAEFAFFHKPHISQLMKPLVNLRTHRKIVICDGLVGFTGGLNITDQEDERVHTNAYHDTHLEMTGNAVHWLQMVFMEDWVYAAKQNVIPDIATYFPLQASGPYPVQDCGFRTGQRLGNHSPHLSEHDLRCQETDMADNALFRSDRSDPFCPDICRVAGYRCPAAGSENERFASGHGCRPFLFRRNDACRCENLGI